MKHETDFVTHSAASRPNIFYPAPWSNIFYPEIDEVDLGQV